MNEALISLYLFYNYFVLMILEGKYCFNKSMSIDKKYNIKSPPITNVIGG